MLSQEIRRKFLTYFKDKGHAVVPSSPVVPHDDPTLLFINAGMNQFKDVFLGKSKRDYSKATTSQKCIRVGGKHNDLDNVGHTSRHLTFFEMLGNFSFGDYFKKEAIAFAWEVTTEIFQFEPEKLWITVFEEDDEAFELWKAHVSEDRIVRMGEKDNFWAMGDTGPCGPCSELYYDRGAVFGDAPNPKEDATEERYLEFWNLVFMEFNRDASGKMSKLPNQSIDTGAGLERLVSLKMGVDNVFYTDILGHLIAQIEKVTGKKYDKEDEKIAPAFHVIADHVRSLAFAIADGAQPSNIERGYVLRKLLRRAVRYGRTLLGVEEPFLTKVFPALLETMGEDYRELVTAKDRIEEIIWAEEEGFIRTLRRGGNILQSIVEKALTSPHKQISGEDAFKLKDTYGFPLEEILLIAKDAGLEVNIDSYQLLEEKAKELSRSARGIQSEQVSDTLFSDFVKKQGQCKFVGYTEQKAETKILAILQDGAFVQSLAEGAEGALILESTPFYAEKGGQVADQGQITSAEASFHVTDCQSPFPDIIIHKGKVEQGRFAASQEVVATIDPAKRAKIAAHHTATHLLHWALQKIIGNHIRQAGSFVGPDRLRFDFNHHKALSAEEVLTIEDLVNEKIRENQAVSTYEIPFEEAQNRSEIKQFFGEKYGTHVRVVDIDYSKELCGGIHVYHVGNLGYFRIAKESSIAAGIRRIEAVCGRSAEEFVRAEEELLQGASTLLKTQPAKLTEKVDQLLLEIGELKGQIRSLKRLQLRSISEELAGKKQTAGKRNLIAESVDVDAEDLGELADEVLSKLGSGVVALALNLGTRVQLVIKISDDLVTDGLSAVKLIKEVSAHISGGGGGKANAAQAGGKNPDGLSAALEAIKTSLSST